MSNNFFDVIGVADMERVHSAVIGWMLSDQCNAFGTDSLRLRSELLQTIFDVKPGKCFIEIKSFVEWNDIDILIVTEDENKEKQYWVIENKVKSSQHSGQLDKYVEIIKNKYEGAEHHFCLLSLIEETPICSTGVTWVNTQYKKLCEELNKKLQNSSAQCDKDHVILNEYVACISQLSNAVNEFLREQTAYSNVFTDGAKKKGEKKNNSKSDTISYISEHGLETIFQKCFLRKVIEDCGKEFLKPFYSFSITETHGTALVDLRYMTINFNQFDVQRVNFGIQFQNGSFKIQILGENDNKTANIKTVEFINFWDNKAKNLWGSAWKKNPSKGNKKPYLSFTQIESWWESCKQPWYQNAPEDIVKVWKGAFDSCKTMIDELMK